ncbi:D-alanyl-D-alanine carboxypeptidase family protein [Herbiconiux liukaitaii]|uniref:D-alanyl-D-alanine carboxypeptidase family protein n=1 Tax=Herbiconiux liukaitaii TaxID=3342799 RepID=UPI0035B9401F
MAGSAGSKAIRAVVIVIGVFVILGIGLYGPATLVGPLPSATATVVETPAEAGVTGAPTLPQTGASALVAEGSDQLLATAGLAEAVPIGGSAKVITALVVLDAKPMEAGSAGATVTISREDYDGFVRYIGESARAVPFIAGENWTQKEMLQATLLGSSNNHADALARWAFGSIEGYLEAASAWLDEHGLTSVELVDATGLDEGDIGTASDLARISALAFAEPAIAEIMPSDGAKLTGGRSVENLSGYQAELGYLGLSRSYTDQAGICFLFALEVAVGSDVPAGTAAAEETRSVTLYGALLREPDWETVDTDLETLASSAASTIRQTPVITAGQAFVTYTTPWGDTAQGVARSTETRMLWVTSPLEYRVEADELQTGSAGREVGSVTVSTPDGDVTVLLELDKRIGDPGPMWRLGNPVPVITAFIDSRTD